MCIMDYTESIAVEDLEVRLIEGKILEMDTYNQLKEKGPWKLERATVNQDKGGIDAFIVGFKDGREIKSPRKIQIKNRQTGDDVLVETVKPVDVKDGEINFKGFTGRDMREDVSLYCCVDTKKRLMMFKGKRVKDAAKDMTEEFLRFYKDHRLPDKPDKVCSLGVVKMRKDHSDEATYGMGKVDKILVFISPSCMKPDYQIQLD